MAASPACRASWDCSRDSSTPIAYEAVDNQPVDLVFLLLAPEGAGADHLKGARARVALVRNQATCEKLRAASKPEVLYALLTEKTNGTANFAGRLTSRDHRPIGGDLLKTHRKANS
jgi:hypothetical protein